MTRNAPYIEIHTGAYAEAPEGQARDAELMRIREAAHYAASLGLKVNAGHGLTYHNVQPIAALPEMHELNTACDIRPHFVCLVPEKRQEVTTEGGLDVAGQQASVSAAVQQLSEAGILVSLFIDADRRQIDAAVASERNARGTHYPDPVQAAFVAEQAGADGITVHLREDRRHITDRDVRILRDTIQTRMNLEMAVTDEMIANSAANR
ncbi:hypothetical protein CRX72_25715 [Pantoea sp. BRM17]|nr:hypothetical protein CRX72_25715 [Pantoea sp. BRM17]